MRILDDGKNQQNVLGYNKDLLGKSVIIINAKGDVSIITRVLISSFCGTLVRARRDNSSTNI